MRCRNCGSENDENLYICQNCGSPLYDENDTPGADSDPTQVFSGVSGAGGESGPPIRSNEERLAKQREEEKKKKQSIIVIAVLCVLLVAIIGGIIFAVAKSKSKTDLTTAPLTVTSIDETTERTTEKTTRETTTEEKTTKETTTETTTEKTTKETTTEKAKKFNVSTSCNNGGETEGDGSYELGETATLIARADDGYEFEGWYKGSKKVSSNSSYSFTVTKDSSYKAVFKIVNEEPPVDDEEGINNIDDND